MQHAGGSIESSREPTPKLRGWIEAEEEEEALLNINQCTGVVKERVVYSGGFIHLFKKKRKKRLT